MNVQDVLKRHIEAIGGARALDALHDFYVRLVYTEGGFSARSSLAQARPYFRLVAVPAGPLTENSVLEGYDGSAWEYYGNPGVILRTVAGAGAIERRNAHQFIDPLVDSSSNSTVLTYSSERVVDGKGVLVLSARFSDGTQENVFVDRRTFLIDGMEQDTQFHAFGKNVPTHIDLDDYRPVGGILMPYRTRQIDNASGRVMDSSVVTSAQANVGLRPAYFAPPRLAPTPLQAAIAAIYQEREDAGAVLQTYRDYRAAYGTTVSSLDAINFIGYQCLKMGDAKSAVALLAANVADYPDSASAHFGLGRALLSERDEAHGRGELMRALAIDPSYKPVQDALAALESSSTQLELRTLPIHSRIFNNDRLLRVLLPPGYEAPAQAATRYPVLYLNDGQDLFDPRDSTFHNGSWLLRESLEALYESGAIRPMIIVGIDNAGHRQRPNEYLPWPDDTLRPAMSHPHGSKYPLFVMNEVMPLVRSRFRTLDDAQDTGIGGASYGALSAIYVAAEEPGRFGRLLIESPSVYPDNYHLITTVKEMSVVPGAVSIGVGTNEDGDPSCGPDHSAGEELQDVLRLRAALVSASRGRSRVRLDISTCATHSPSAWGARFPSAIAFLFGPPR